MFTIRLCWVKDGNTSKIRSFLMFVYLFVDFRSHCCESFRTNVSWSPFIFTLNMIFILFFSVLFTDRNDLTYLLSDMNMVTRFPPVVGVLYWVVSILSDTWTVRSHFRWSLLTMKKVTRVIYPEEWIEWLRGLEIGKIHSRTNRSIRKNCGQILNSSIITPPTPCTSYLPKSPVLHRSWVKQNTEVNVKFSRDKIETVKSTLLVSVVQGNHL